jgi:DNA-binding CsgD family transcriptional regulator
MGKSQRLRLGDVRAVFRMIAECRELGADARGWRSHLLAGLCRLAGSRVAISSEAVRENGRLVRPVLSVDFGWASPEEARVWPEFMQQHLDQDIVYQRFFLTLFRGGQLTLDRCQFVSDREWYGSPTFNEFFRRARVDVGVLSAFDSAEGRYGDCIVLLPDAGDEPISDRSRRLVRLLHQELGPMIGRTLASVGDPSPGDLSPRLREVLACLLEGDGEKQLAARLGLSRETAHEYVQRVYRHFRVNTRAELMAYFLRRSGLRPPGQTP